MILALQDLLDLLVLVGIPDLQVIQDLWVIAVPLELQELQELQAGPL